MLEKNIVDMFGFNPMSFSAYVATSTQHEELDSSDEVVGSQLCSALLSNGFKVQIAQNINNSIKLVLCIFLSCHV
jgi:hypothetical protein